MRLIQLRFDRRASDKGHRLVTAYEHDNPIMRLPFSKWSIGWSVTALPMSPAAMRFGVRLDVLDRAAVMETTANLIIDPVRANTASL